MRRKKTTHINALRQYRKLMKYTQQDVAGILGVNSIGAISQWESGTTLPSLDNMFRLSILFKTLPEVLFFELVLVIRADVSKGLKKHNKKKAKSNRIINNNRLDVD